MSEQYGRNITLKGMIYRNKYCDMKNTKLEEIKTLVESEICIHALICHVQLFTFACHGRKNT